MPTSFDLTVMRSTAEMSNSTGTIVARYSYDSYGRTTLISGSNLATFQYTGYYAHQTSGLSLAKYRAYDSKAGRWLTKDPSGEESGLNLYAYVSENPILFTDPEGLSTGGAYYELTGVYFIGVSGSFKEVYDRVNRRLELTHFKAFKIDPPWGKKGEVKTSG